MSIKKIADIARVVNFTYIGEAHGSSRITDAIKECLANSLDAEFVIADRDIIEAAKVDGEGAEAPVEGAEGTPPVNTQVKPKEDKKKKAERAKDDKKIPLKTLLKVQEEIDTKFNLIESAMIDGSNGDIKNLANKAYARVLVPTKENMGAIIEASSKGKSKYLKIYEDLLKAMIKHKPSFTKAYRKRNSSITKMAYKSGVMYLIEMSTMLTNTLVYMYNRERKDFDRLLDKTRDHKELFQHAEKFTEMLNDKLFKEELKIVESDLDEPLLVGEMSSYISEASMSISTASRLINFGLSASIYKLFALFRYIIYLTFYRKYTIQNKIDMVAKNIDVMEMNESSPQVKRALDEATKEGQNFRTDSIEAGNKADVEINKGENIDLDF